MLKSNLHENMKHKKENMFIVLSNDIYSFIETRLKELKKNPTRYFQYSVT